LWNLLSRRARARRPAARRRPTTPLGVECLERRIVPALTGTLKVDGITGNQPGGEIAITSYAFSESNASGQMPTLGDVHVTLKESSATPALLLADMTGKHIKSAAVIERNTSNPDKPFEALRYTLSDVVISSFQVKLGPKDLVPTDDITLQFARIQERVTPRGGGPITATWDLATRIGSVAGTAHGPDRTNAAVGLKIDGVPGEFLNGSAVDSYSFSESSPVAGHPTLGDVTVRLKSGVASPYLFLANETGQTFKSAALTVYRTTKDGQFESELIALTNARVTSYTSADGEDAVTLSFDRIAERVTPASPGGKPGSEIRATWDDRIARGSITDTAPPPARANTPLGLKVPGVPGEFLNGSAVTSYSWGAAGASEVLPDFRFALPTGVASPYLFLANDTGQTFKSATLTAYHTTKGGQVQTEQITLTNARVTSYTTANGQDAVTFTFDKITITYRPIKPDGTFGPPVTVTWSQPPPVA
jgi:type VI protein secretion system component Hcp